MEQLAADWKALDGRLRESLQPPAPLWTKHQHVVQHQPSGKDVSRTCLLTCPVCLRHLFHVSDAVSAVPSAVQMASLVSEDPRHQTPHTPDTVAPTDLNETATELADWLLLITQMLKSNIVTVGDTEEIRTTMRRLQVRTEEGKRWKAFEKSTRQIEFTVLATGFCMFSFLPRAHR